MVIELHDCVLDRLAELDREPVFEKAMRHLAHVCHDEGKHIVTGSRKALCSGMHFTASKQRATSSCVLRKSSDSTNQGQQGAARGVTQRVSKHPATSASVYWSQGSAATS